MSRTIAYVGCRTTRERNADGKGISAYEVHRTGAWQHLQTLGTLANPMFLALSGVHDTLYAVQDNEPPSTAALARVRARARDTLRFILIIC